MTFIVAATGASAWLLLIGAGHRGHRLRHDAQHHDQRAQEEEVARRRRPAPGRRQSARANAPLRPSNESSVSFTARARPPRTSKTAAVPEAVSRQMSALQGT